MASCPGEGLPSGSDGVDRMVESDGSSESFLFGESPGDQVPLMERDDRTTQ